MLHFMKKMFINTQRLSTVFYKDQMESEGQPDILCLNGNSVSSSRGICKQIAGWQGWCLVPKGNE